MQTYHPDSLAVFPDGKKFASGNLREIKLWQNNKCIQTIATEGWVKALAIRSDGAMISGGSDKKIRAWKDGVCIQTLWGHTGGIQTIKLFDDGTIVSAGSDKTVKIWKEIWNGTKYVYQCTQTLEGHTDTIWEVVVLPDKTIASGSQDGTIRFWQNGKCNSAKTIVTQSACNALAAFSDGAIIAGYSGGSIKMQDKEGKCSVEFKHNGGICSLTILDNDTFAAGDFANKITIYNKNGETIETLVGHSDTIHCLAAQSSGALISAGRQKDKSLRIWAPPAELDLKKPEDQKEFCNALLINSSLTDLDLNGLDLSSSINALCKLIATHPNLKRLDISNTNLTDQSCHLLLTALSSNSIICKIDVTKNNLDKELCSLLGFFLAVNNGKTTFPSFEALGITNPKNIVIALNLIKERKIKITSFDFSNIKFTKELSELLVKIFAENTNITSLNLSNACDEFNLPKWLDQFLNLHAPQEQKSLWQILLGNNSLLSLSLNGLPLSDDAVEHLCQLIIRHRTLKNISLSIGNLAPQSWQKLLAALCKNPNIEKFDISWQQPNYQDENNGELALDDELHKLELEIEPKVPPKIKSQFDFLLAVNNKVKNIYFKKLEVTEDDSIIFCLKLLCERKPMFITSIDLSTLTLTIEHCELLATVIATSNSIKFLDLSKINFTEEMATSLLQSIKKNTSIIELKFDNTNLSLAKSKHLQAIMRRNAGKILSGNGDELQPQKLLPRKLSPNEKRYKEIMSFVPKFMRCPITNKIMRQPVIASNGITYEQETIATLFEKKNTKKLSSENDSFFPTIKNSEIIKDIKNLSAENFVPNKFAEQAITEFLDLYPELKYTTAAYISPAKVRKTEEAVINNSIKEMQNLIKQDYRLLVLPLFNNETFALITVACHRSTPQLLEALFKELEEEFWHLPEIENDDGKELFRLITKNLYFNKIPNPIAQNLYWGEAEYVVELKYAEKIQDTALTAVCLATIVELKNLKPNMLLHFATKYLGNEFLASFITEQWEKTYFIEAINAQNDNEESAAMVIAKNAGKACDQLLAIIMQCKKNQESHDLLKKIFFQCNKTQWNLLHTVAHHQNTATMQQLIKELPEDILNSALPLRTKDSFGLLDFGLLSLTATYQDKATFKLLLEKVSPETIVSSLTEKELEEFIKGANSVQGQENINLLRTKYHFKKNCATLNQKIIEALNTLSSSGEFNLNWFEKYKEVKSECSILEKHFATVPKNSKDYILMQQLTKNWQDIDLWLQLYDAQNNEQSNAQNNLQTNPGFIKQLNVLVSTNKNLIWKLSAPVSLDILMTASLKAIDKFCTLNNIKIFNSQLSPKLWNELLPLLPEHQFNITLDASFNSELKLNHPNLVYLDLSNNNSRKTSMMEKLLEQFKGHMQLKTLLLNNVFLSLLTEISTQQFFMLLANLPNLRSLELRNNTLNNLQFTLLLEYLKSNIQLEHLDLRDCKFTVEQINQLTDIIAEYNFTLNFCLLNSYLGATNKLEQLQIIIGKRNKNKNLWHKKFIQLKEQQEKLLNSLNYVDLNQSGLELEKIALESETRHREASKDLRDLMSVYYPNNLLLNELQRNSTITDFLITLRQKTLSKQESLEQINQYYLKMRTLYEESTLIKSNPQLLTNIIQTYINTLIQINTLDFANFTTALKIVDENKTIIDATINKCLIYKYHLAKICTLLCNTDTEEKMEKHIKQAQSIFQNMQQVQLAELIPSNIFNVISSIFGNNMPPLSRLKNAIAFMQWAIKGQNIISLVNKDEIANKNVVNDSLINGDVINNDVINNDSSNDNKINNQILTNNIIGFITTIATNNLTKKTSGIPAELDLIQTLHKEIVQNNLLLNFLQQPQIIAIKNNFYDLIFKVINNYIDAADKNVSAYNFAQCQNYYQTFFKLLQIIPLEERTQYYNHLIPVILNLAKSYLSNILLKLELSGFSVKFFNGHASIMQKDLENLRDKIKNVIQEDLGEKKKIENGEITALEQLDKLNNIFYINLQLMQLPQNHSTSYWRYLFQQLEIAKKFLEENRKYIGKDGKVKNNAENNENNISKNFTQKIKKNKEPSAPPIYLLEKENNFSLHPNLLDTDFSETPNSADDINKLNKNKLKIKKNTLIENKNMGSKNSIYPDLFDNFDDSNNYDNQPQYSTITTNTSVNFNSSSVVKNEIAQLLMKLKEKNIAITEEDNDEIKDFICPITHSIMLFPVINAAGHHYEQNAIQEWYRKCKENKLPPTDPINNAEVSNGSCFIDFSLKSKITEFLIKKLKEGTIKNNSMEKKIIEQEEIIKPSAMDNN